MSVKEILPPSIVITGWWNGEPIWRYKTADEKLADAGMSKEAADLWIKLNSI